MSQAFSHLKGGEECRRGGRQREGEREKVGEGHDFYFFES